VTVEAFKAGKITHYRMARLIGFAWSNVASMGFDVIKCFRVNWYLSFQLQQNTSIFVFRL